MSEQAINTLKKSYDLKKLNKFNSHKSHKSATEVDILVSQLVEQYGAPQFIPLFRKAAWYLPQTALVTFTEKAAGKTSPLAYFVTCAKNELLKTC
jgi:hypothetical protein